MYCILHCFILPSAVFRTYLYRSLWQYVSFHFMFCSLGFTTYIFTGIDSLRQMNKYTVNKYKYTSICGDHCCLQKFMNILFLEIKKSVNGIITFISKKRKRKKCTQVASVNIFLSKFRFVDMIVKKVKK